MQPTDKAAGHRVTVRIDPEPGYKRFQGVWLHHADGTQWILDYRAHQLWTWFADREVVVTGKTYRPAPDVQSISATHFELESMRTDQQGLGPYLSIGPKQTWHGELVARMAPAGSKLAGTESVHFVADDGSTYLVANEPAPTRRGRVRITGRICEPDMSYTARTNGPDVWIEDARGE